MQIAGPGRGRVPVIDIVADDADVGMRHTRRLERLDRLLSVAVVVVETSECANGHAGLLYRTV